jgi:geranylgeranyl reductase family protein
VTYDLIVVGAGPAGSTLAREMALQGAHVLLLDRARFPRDKPCGGGVTLRAARLLPLDLTPVVERTVFRACVSLRCGPGFIRFYPEPLTYMTQRCRLDSFLAERAAEAGADFRDGVRVSAVEVGANGAQVRIDGDVLQGSVVAGADGAYGVVASALGLTPCAESAVALEGNLPCSEGVLERWSDLVALDLGGLPGGYGWVFPKSDHVNVGVGAWRYAAPALRGYLARLCRHLGFSEERLRGARGHLLPMRRPGAPIVSGPALLLGDAAGLVDPLSGEGIYSALLSARLAAPALQAYLAGQVLDLSGYERAVDREIMADLITSRRLQEIFHCTPAPYVAALRLSDYLWRSLCRIIRGDISYSHFRHRLGIVRPVLDGWSEVARRSNWRRRPTNRAS